MRNTTFSTAVLAAILTSAAMAAALPSAFAADPAPAGSGDYLVTAPGGKGTVWASRLASGSAAANELAPGAAAQPSRDYPVTIGKRTVLASALAKQPAGTAIAPQSESRPSGGSFATDGKRTIWTEGDVPAPSVSSPAAMR